MVFNTEFCRHTSCSDLSLRGDFKVKSWGIIIVTALGFLMGLVLAGVGVTSAKTLLFSAKHAEKKTETYWADTGLGQKELDQLISNLNCQSSEKYFLSCINSIIQVLPKYHMSLSAENGQITKSYLTSSLDGKSEKENLKSFVQMYEKQKNGLVNFESIWSQILDTEKSKVQQAQLVGIGINAFLSVYKDPHSYILPSDYFDEVGSKFERSNLFVGISFEKKNSDVFVRKVYKNSDAETAGLKSQDQLLEINGQLAANLNLFDIGQLLKDGSTKKFQLKMNRNGSIINIEIDRSFKKLNHVIVEKESGLRDYAVVTLSKFSHGVCAEIARRIKSLSTESISGMVLDLRDNPGGELNEASCIAGLFIGINKKIYAVKYFDPIKVDEVALTTGSLLYTGPLVLLVNSSSASAAELLAGALQEYNRAILVGERTFGKGTFQEGETWIKNSKITFFRTQGFYLLPSGASPQLKGIIPDLVQPENHQNLRESTSYFNPIAANHDFDVESKEIPKQVRFTSEFKKCLPTMSYAKDDQLLKMGLEILACHRISSLMATEYSANDFN